MRILSFTTAIIFSLSPLLPALAAGTPVEFSFRQDAQGYRLNAIHPVQP